MGGERMKADVFVSVVAVLRSYARFLPAVADEVCRTLEDHYTNYELVLVDNGSRDDTAAYLSCTRPDVQVRELSTDGGAAARDAGVRALHTDLVAFTGDGPSVLGFLPCAAVVRRCAFLSTGGLPSRFGSCGEEELVALDLAAAGLGLA
jgi:hypothetical protein